MLYFLNTISYFLINRSFLHGICRSTFIANTWSAGIFICDVPGSDSKVLMISFLSISLAESSKLSWVLPSPPLTRFLAARSSLLRRLIVTLLAAELETLGELTCKNVSGYLVCVGVWVHFCICEYFGSPVLLFSAELWHLSCQTGSS